MSRDRLFAFFFIHSLVSRTGISLPQKFRFTLRLCHPPSQDEQGVAQTVQVFVELCRDRFLAHQTDADPLGAAANRPGLMERRRYLPPTGENEFLERRQILLAAVDHALKLRDILCRDMMF